MLLHQNSLCPFFKIFFLSFFILMLCCSVIHARIKILKKKKIEDTNPNLRFPRVQRSTLKWVVMSEIYKIIMMPKESKVKKM